MRALFASSSHHHPPPATPLPPSRSRPNRLRLDRLSFSTRFNPLLTSFQAPPALRCPSKRHCPLTPPSFSLSPSPPAIVFHVSHRLWNKQIHALVGNIPSNRYNNDPPGPSSPPTPDKGIAKRRGPLAIPHLPDAPRSVPSSTSSPLPSPPPPQPSSPDEPSSSVGGNASVTTSPPPLASPPARRVSPRTEGVPRTCYTRQPPRYQPRVSSSSPQRKRRSSPSGSQAVQSLESPSPQATQVQPSSARGVSQVSSSKKRGWPPKAPLVISDEPPQPPPRGFACILRDASTHQMCQCMSHSPSQALFHLRSAHSTAERFLDENSPFDLTSMGCASCVSCRDVFTISRFKDHVCPSARPLPQPPAREALASPPGSSPLPESDASLALTGENFPSLPFSLPPTPVDPSSAPSNSCSPLDPSSSGGRVSPPPSSPLPQLGQPRPSQAVSSPIDPDSRSSVDPVSSPPVAHPRHLPATGSPHPDSSPQPASSSQPGAPGPQPRPLHPSQHVPPPVDVGLPSDFEFYTADPWACLGLDADGSLPFHLRFFDAPTPKRLPPEVRLMLSHCVTILAERMLSAPDSEAARWFALWHILPRLLVPQEALQRAGVSQNPRSRSRRRSSSRRVSAPFPEDRSDDIFRNRCLLFLNGRWDILLPPPCSPLLFPHRALQKEFSP